MVLVSFSQKRLSKYEHRSKPGVGAEIVKSEEEG